jgi:hypothetical protein
MEMDLELCSSMRTFVGQIYSASFHALKVNIVIRFLSKVFIVEFFSWAAKETFVVD